MANRVCHGRALTEQGHLRQCPLADSCKLHKLYEKPKSHITHNIIDPGPYDFDNDSCSFYEG